MIRLIYYIIIMFLTLSFTILSCEDGNRKSDETSHDDETAYYNDPDQMIEQGKMVYTRNCQSCHQADGQGIAGAFPPVANSDYLNEDVERSIDVIIHGLEGQIKVNGKIFNGIMPKVNLNDQEVANVLTYIYNSWDNNGTVITPKQVAARRK